MITRDGRRITGNATSVIISSPPQEIGNSYFLRAGAGSLSHPDATPALGSAGDVLIFDCRVDHTAGVNDSDDARAFVQVRRGEKGVIDRLAQKVQVGPCIPVRVQLEKADVGPTSGPTWRLSHSRVSRY